MKNCMLTKKIRIKKEMMENYDKSDLALYS